VQKGNLQPRKFVDQMINVIEEKTGDKAGESTDG
jgi:hypothetical protein